MRRGCLMGFIALTLSACESDEATEPKPVSSTAEVRQRVLSSCEAFAERLCQSAEACCVASARSLDITSCRDLVVGDVCGPAADAVAAGFATYHEEAVEPCLAAHAVSHETCVADWSELLELRRGIWSACKVVRGTAAAGRGCTSSVTCAQPEGASVAHCITGHCRVLELLGEGAECPYPNGEVSVCDAGLYCSARERDEIGVCAPVTAPGAACDPVALNPECGLGSYCDLEASVCRQAENFGGPSCEQATECVSFECDRIIGECVPPLPTVAELCPQVL